MLRASTQGPSGAHAVTAGPRSRSLSKLPGGSQGFQRAAAVDASPGTVAGLQHSPCSSPALGASGAFGTPGTAARSVLRDGEIAPELAGSKMEAEKKDAAQQRAEGAESPWLRAVSAAACRRAGAGTASSRSSKPLARSGGRQKLPAPSQERGEPRGVQESRTLLRELRSLFSRRSETPRLRSGCPRLPPAFDSGTAELQPHASLLAPAALPLCCRLPSRPAPSAAVPLNGANAAGPRQGQAASTRPGVARPQLAGAGTQSPVPSARTAARASAAEPGEGGWPPPAATEREGAAEGRDRPGGRARSRRGTGQEYVCPHRPEQGPAGQQPPAAAVRREQGCPRPLPAFWGCSLPSGRAAELAPSGAEELSRSVWA